MLGTERSMRTLAGLALSLVALLFSLAGAYFLFLELSVAHKDTLYWAIGGAFLLFAALSAIPAWLILGRPRSAGPSRPE